jgi:UPF0176 protein
MGSTITQQFQVSAFYHFSSIEDPVVFRERLLVWLNGKGILGTVLVAHEGVNGTVSGGPGEVDALMVFLSELLGLEKLPFKRAFCAEQPFHRLKVRLKKEIVTLGVEGIDPTLEVGVYVAPEDWNALISREDVFLVDTRNDYEYAVGSFKGAIDPGTSSFREFPDFVERAMDPQKQSKVAMFCTGGIRCEKATAYMLQKGFKEVYHLQGGILEYLNRIPPEESLWQGECFVFDERVTVDHSLNQGSYVMCHACRIPLNETDILTDAYVEGISCPYCVGHLSEDKKARLQQRQFQMDLAKKRNEKHLGGQHPRHQVQWSDELG